MDFSLTEQQTMFRDMVRDFAAKEIAPIAEKMDHDNAMPEALIDKMRANGFFGLAFPEQYGGLGVDTITYGLVVEERSACTTAWAAIPSPCSATRTSSRRSCRAWPPARSPPSA